MRKWHWSALVAATITAGMMAGCAQDVGDIDRTQPNKVLKDDLVKGVWWMNQKVVDSSSTNLNITGPFEGSMAETDKVRFVVEENYLLAYRAYPILPGSDDMMLNVNGTNNYEELYGPNYKGSIRAMFPIESHFDVQRKYDSSTGEQSNVISENTSDRPWYERSYMRVKWDENPILDPWWEYEGYDLTIGRNGENKGDIAATQPYFERDSNGLLVYFDAPATYIIKPTIWDLYFYVAQISFADPYAATEARIVTSFARALSGITSDGDTINNANYEPLPYDNYDMNRFGYFLVEQDTLDPLTGQIMDAGHIQMANRHDIWENNYTTDDQGNRVALPIELRKVKTTPFYIFDMPNEEHMANMSTQLVDEWNVAFKRAVYLIQNPTNPIIENVVVPKVNTLGESSGELEDSARSVNVLTEIDYPVLKAALASQKDVFVPCHVPVIESDSELCVPDYLIKQGVERVGYTPREGDFRKNYLWVVNQNLENGLLGYGPTADDPLTSQSISSQAHVYTGPMNYYATRIIDRIKFLNGELTADGIRANDANIARAQSARDRFIELQKVPSKVLNAKLDAQLTKNAKREFNMKRDSLLAKKPLFNYTKADNRLKALTAKGVLATSFDDALEGDILARSGAKSLSQLKGMPSDLLGSLYSPKERAYAREIEKKMARKGFCSKTPEAGMSSDVEFLFWAKHFKDRNDYENIHKEIRAQVYRATALHEMGHTFGLRHNFGASSDSMNYFNNFWTERKKSKSFNTEKVETLADLYDIYDVTDDQIEKGMHVAQYSSIMDYYVDNYHGLGRYDHAAILYAYSGGTSLVRDENRAPITDPAVCASKGGSWKTINVDGSDNAVSVCMKFQKGLIEYFAKDASSGAIAGSSDMGSFPYSILTHKDTTGISTFDDQISIAQPYLELVHYRDFFSKANKTYSFENNRALVRIEDYLAAKAGKDGAGSAMVRVPYVFCTDDNHGKLSSCYMFDAGADHFERTLYYINNYNNEYWFTNFRRGRAYWSAFSAAYGRPMRHFMMLSDLFQHNYVSDNSILEDVLGSDLDLSYQVGQMASDASFNFLASVLATPEYGVFCKSKLNNSMVVLSSNEDARAEVSEFRRVGYCGSNPSYYYVPQGQGRNRFSKYDVNAGFDYSQYELESPHVYTTIAAIIALFDNEADVIVDTGDMNTYLFGMYDRYKSELTKLMDSAYSESYNAYSPVLVRNGNETTTFQGDEYETGTLVYPPLAETRFYLDGSNVGFNALTGQPTLAFNKLAASVAAWGKCSSSNDCVPSDKASRVVCSTLYREQTEDRCISLFDAANKDNANCPTGTVMEDVSGDGSTFACVITDAPAGITAALDAIAAQPCSDKNREGFCSGNNHCANVNGSYQCVANAMRVESNTSLTQKTYIALYGMLLTGMYGSDSTFYDQFNIYRVGSGETVTPPKGYKSVTFEDPTTGAIYAANELDCSGDSIWCSADNKVIDGNGGAMIIKRANAAKARVEDKYAELLKLDITDDDEKNNTPAYQKYMETLYDWYLAKWDLDSAIYDVNFIRSTYNILSSLF